MHALKLVLLFYLPYLVSGQTLGFALEQLEGEAMMQVKLNGSGVKIGIIDGGFLDADSNPSLHAHFQENRVAYYRDFVTPEMEPYTGSKPLGDNHGTEVWQQIGGYHPDRKVLFGLATNATYYLARTDHGAYEKREEERQMIKAMDEMIRLGVRLFNVSLGYTNDYTNKAEDYEPGQIDGKSTWITRSLDSLLAIHDVLVIVSAGNDGNNPWRILSAPADSPNVITVGATKMSSWEEMEYSSIGPDWLSYVKPDISCFSTIGTSYSAPVITGLAACVMQYDSTLSPAQIKNVLIRSAHLYPYANNYIGYGVPSAAKLLGLLQNKAPTPVSVQNVRGNNTTLSFEMENLRHPMNLVLYHKQGWKVVKKEQVKVQKKVRIDRPQGCDATTILIGKSAMEIRWEQE